MPTAHARERADYLDLTYDMFIGSIDGEQAESIRFAEWVDAVTADDAYAFEARRLGAQRPAVAMRRTNGRALDVVNMSSYNYLGLGYHPDVIEAAKCALDRYGLGAASSPVHSGTFEVHEELEHRLVEFLGLPDRAATLFSSGYAVNTGTISALMRKHHHIVMDRSIHMSILEGAQLARSKLAYFRHNDADHLREVLDEIAPRASRILVCSEGVFSGDGDFGAIARIADVAKTFGAQVLVDEAHSFLVAGPTGRGVAEAQGALGSVDYFITTFSKALGGVGGALIATRPVVQYVNWYARCRMFSCAIDPAVTAGIAKALEIAASAEGEARRQRLQRNVGHLRRRLTGRVDLGASESWIVTVVYGAEELTIPLLDWLQRAGLDASVLQFPAVPVNESRIRLFVSSEHTFDQLDRAASIVLEAARRFGFSHVREEEHVD